MEQLAFRSAEQGDLPRLVALLADDPLGKQREVRTEPLPEAYLEAFERIAKDPNNALVVACLADGLIVGMMQLTVTPCLTHGGSSRLQLEGVRVAAAYRSQGIGEALIAYAKRRAAEQNCRIVQLTTDKRRPDALRFYQRLGFEATHEGLKMRLEP